MKGCGCQNQVHSVGLRLSTAKVRAHWGQNCTAKDHHLMTFGEVTVKTADVSWRILTCAAHGVICRVSPFFGSYHSQTKSGWWRGVGWRACAFSHVTLLQCLDSLHAAKGKRTRKAGLCRNTGAELFCTPVGGATSRNGWPKSPRGCRTTLPAPVPPALVQSCSFCLPLSLTAVKKLASAGYQGFGIHFALLLCYLSLVHQHPQLLQERFLTPSSARLCSGARFDHRYLR